MPPDRHPPGSYQEWLARAKGDLALASMPLPEGAYYEDLCFHAQQAAEKALKSIYVYHDISFRYVHDLEELITGLRKMEINPPEEVCKAVELTAYAIDARYPGMEEPVMEIEYKTALDRANAVVKWAESMVGLSKA